MHDPKPLSERVREEATPNDDYIYMPKFWHRIADEIAALERDNAALRAELERVKSRRDSHAEQLEGMFAARRPTAVEPEEK